MSLFLFFIALVQDLRDLHKVLSIQVVVREADIFEGDRTTRIIITLRLTVPFASHSTGLCRRTRPSTKGHIWICRDWHPLSVNIRAVSAIDIGEFTMSPSTILMFLSV